MKSILLTIAAATMLWIGGTFTSTADAQYVRYGRGYYSSPRYYGGYNYAPRYYGPRAYSASPYRSYYGGYYGGNYPYYGYNAPYYTGYRGGYYSRPYYDGGYYRPGVRVGVGPARIGIGF